MKNTVHNKMLNKTVNTAYSNKYSSPDNYDKYPTNDNIITVTNRHLCNRPFMEQLERVCRLHPHAIVLREKDMPEADYLSLARDVIDLCQKYDVPCIFHSFVNVALELNHPYIHLPLASLEQLASTRSDINTTKQTSIGQTTDISTNRTESDLDYQHYFKVIGTSVHSVSDAVRAEKLGATYLTAGHIFATDCKKELPPRGLDFLRDVCDSVDIPVYAIGGINIDNVVANNLQTTDSFCVPRLNEVLSHGAVGACIMSSMMRV